MKTASFTLQDEIIFAINTYCDSKTHTVCHLLVKNAYETYNGLPGLMIIFYTLWNKARTHFGVNIIKEISLNFQVIITT